MMPDLSRLNALAIALGATVAFGLLVRLGVRLAIALTPAPALPSPRALASRRLLGSAIGQGLSVALVAALLLRAGLSLGDLGFARTASPAAWGAAVLLAALVSALMIAGPLRGNATLTEWSPYRVSGGLLAGMAAGFGEEVVFRGFIMTALAWGGFGHLGQVTGSALLFGLAYAGWGLLGRRASAPAALRAMCSTALVGVLYSLLYLWSGRSLMPVIAAHAITDLIIEPALLETMIARHEA